MTAMTATAANQDARDTGPVSSDPRFPADLHRGTARFYDEFRVGYP
jgi:hypothetical protein